MKNEKKMFENIFNMIMDMKRKTNDNMKKARIYIPFYHHKNIELIYNEHGSQSPKLVSP